MPQLPAAANDTAYLGLAMITVSVLAAELLMELASVWLGLHSGYGQRVNDTDGGNYGEYRGKPPVSPQPALPDQKRGVKVGVGTHADWTMGRV